MIGKAQIINSELKNIKLKNKAMKTMTYKVSDLKALIAEGSNEFKAKLGPGVESGDKANNGKAYKDADKRAMMGDLPTPLR